MMKAFAKTETPEFDYVPARYIDYCGKIWERAHQVPTIFDAIWFDIQHNNTCGQAIRNGSRMLRYMSIARMPSLIIWHVMTMLFPIMALQMPQVKTTGKIHALTIKLVKIILERQRMVLECNIRALGPMQRYSNPW